MKKRAFLLLIGLTVMLAGCAGTPAGSTMEQTQSTGAVDGELRPDNASGTDAQTGSGAEKMAEGWQYIWQEITVTLPKDWEERCVIVENEDGFCVYQKASYQENPEWGYLCGICRTTEYLNYGAGETLLAYTNEGLFYYMMQPTDVSTGTDDDAVLGEYIWMCGQAADVGSSMQVADSDIRYDAKEYVIPVSSIVALEQYMLADWSDNSLWIARNEIYARHGRQFSNAYLQEYFNRCSWYEGTIPAEQFDENSLSPIEKDNIKLLAAAEQEYDRQHPYPKEYKTTETAVEDLSGNGKSNKIQYQVTGTQCILTVDGESFSVNEMVYMDDPVTDVFYITDILEYDNVLEIAVLDYGPSDDPVTYFFRYGDTLVYIGQVGGFPFAEQDNGVNGFHPYGGITGLTRTDLIETAYLEGYWQYDSALGEIMYLDTGWNVYRPNEGHTLYENLPVHYRMDEESATMTIPAQTKVFFMGTDMWEWILVRGKDGKEGYIRIVDGKVAGLDKEADKVFSDLYYFD